MSYEEVRVLAGIAGLLLFVGFFVVMLIWVFRPGSKRTYDRAAMIPLRDEPPHAARKEV